MTLLNDIYIAQRNAGEDAVSANLERMGLVPPRPNPQRDLMASQVPLGREFSEVLHENLWELYESDDPDDSDISRVHAGSVDMPALPALPDNAESNGPKAPTRTPG